MPADVPRVALDRWCDAKGTHVALFCWVEPVVERPEHGVLLPRLRHRGQVIGRGLDVLYVHFQGEDQLISVSPQRVRLLPDEPDGRGW